MKKMMIILWAVSPDHRDVGAPTCPDAGIRSRSSVPSELNKINQSITIQILVMVFFF